jgi:hypothetical protein
VTVAESGSARLTEALLASNLHAGAHAAPAWAPVAISRSSHAGDPEAVKFETTPMGYRWGDEERNYSMIILGVVLLLLGALLDIGILYTIGGILAVIGVVLWLLGAFGRQIGPRAHYY